MTRGRLSGRALLALPLLVLLAACGRGANASETTTNGTTATTMHPVAHDFRSAQSAAEAFEAQHQKDLTDSAVAAWTTLRNRLDDLTLRSDSGVPVEQLADDWQRFQDDVANFDTEIRKSGSEASSDVIKEWEKVKAEIDRIAPDFE